MVAEIEYGAAPESFRQFHADRPAYVVDEAEVAARLTTNHLRSIELCRKVRKHKPGSLRVQLVDAHHATVASLSKATCRAHILSLDADGYPTHCALCPGYDGTRHCSHIGAYLLYFLRRMLGTERAVKRMCIAASHAMYPSKAELAAYEQRTEVGQAIPTSGENSVAPPRYPAYFLSNPRPVAPQDIYEEDPLDFGWPNEEESPEPGRDRSPVAPQDIPEIESVAHRGQLFREEGSR